MIVGKRALPAMSLTNDVATLTGIASREGSPRSSPTSSATWPAADDIALGVSGDGNGARTSCAGWRRRPSSAC